MARPGAMAVHATQELLFHHEPTDSLVAAAWKPGCITGGSVLHPTGRDENTRRRKARPKFLKSIIPEHLQRRILIMREIQNGKTPHPWPLARGQHGGVLSVNNRKTLFR